MINNNSMCVFDVSVSYEKTPLLSKDEIKVIVENSQAIEGYASASKEYEDAVEVFMQKHNVKVSA